MPTRTIMGVIRQPVGGQPWAGAVVEIRHMGPPWVASDGIYPLQSQAVTADESGEVSVTLAVPAEGAARYGLWLPEAKREIPFALAACQDDEPVRLEDLLEIALVAMGHMALPTRGPGPNYYGFFMQRVYLETHESLRIPAGHQMIVVGSFRVDGALEVDGELVVL